MLYFFFPFQLGIVVSGREQLALCERDLLLSGERKCEHLDGSIQKVINFFFFL